jgi:cytochrome c oxidase accessory protein FixG
MQPSVKTAATSAERGSSSDRVERSIRLLEASDKIYPRAVSGVFARWRWGMVWLTQLVYYGLPWFSWNNREAVLFDLAARKFYIFGLVLYPQDFIYLTGLLVISALSLFLFTTVAGRLWCGYSCPQTVYTEIFMWVERLVEGNRNKRMKLDRSGRSVNKVARKSLKHFLWLSIALWTGITFVGYFTPIRELVARIATLDTGPWQSFWILFYAFATYGNAGFMREQVCKYMCPYARFQGVMFDRDTLVITYDSKRGEPRGSRSRKSRGEGQGDCVDCSLCVQVCPVGIDIRDGQQYECIGCAACIDACDQVMDKMGYPKQLIRYNTLNNDEKQTGYSWRELLIRPRVMVYSLIMLTAIGIFLGTLSMRVNLKVDVMRDRATLSREVSDGLIENVFKLMIINNAETIQRYRVSVAGIESAFIDSAAEIEVPAASHRLVPVRVRVQPQYGHSGSNEIVFTVQSVDDTATVRHEKSVFYLPHTP